MRIFRNNGIYLILFFLPAAATPAQQNGDPGAPSASGGGYFADWFARVDKTQAEQPHWITPVATTTPRLEEEYRDHNGIFTVRFPF